MLQGSFQYSFYVQSFLSNNVSIISLRVKDLGSYVRNTPRFLIDWFWFEWIDVACELTFKKWFIWYGSLHFLCRQHITTVGCCCCSWDLQKLQKIPRLVMVAGRRRMFSKLRLSVSVLDTGCGSCLYLSSSSPSAKPVGEMQKYMSGKFKSLCKLYLRDEYIMKTMLVSQR